MIDDSIPSASAGNSVHDKLLKQQFLENILENAPLVIWSIDTDGIFTYSQYKGTSGIDLNNRIGKSVLEIYRGTEVELFLQKVLKGEISRDIICVDSVFYDTRVSPIRNEKGEKTGFLGISLDVTDRIKKERELQKFRQVLDQAPGSVFILDKDWRFEYVNPKFTELSGFTIEELLHKTTADTVYKGLTGLPESRKEIALYLGEGKNWQGELLTVNKNGGHYWANTIAAPFKDSDGKIDGYVVIQQDITEKKRMEVALVEQEKLYRSLIEKTLDGIVISQDGKVVLVNHAFAEMLGYSVEECIASFGSESIAQEDRERVLDIHFRRMRGEIGDMRYTAGIIGKSGEKVIAEFNTTTIEFNGKPASLVSTRDISERKALENALRESEMKYRTLIEKALDGIIITQQGRLKFVNKAFCDLIHYREEELIDKPYLDFVFAGDHQQMNSYHKRRMEGEDFQAIYRSKIYKKDGTLLEVELNARTSEYNGGPAAFIIVRDITDRLKTEEELRKAKTELEMLNQSLENRVRESTVKLTEANTQLIRLQKENLQSQFEVLRQQVNPHFLFNSLNVLTSLIKLDPDLAEKFTEHLSKVYRYVLENKDNDLVTLNTELDFLDAYIFLLNIRFMDKIQVNVAIDEGSRKLLVIPLALQLLIENAIKHNSMSKKAPLKIEIRVDSENVLVVENNLQERESHMASTGVGLKNIEHRYRLLEMPAPQFYKTETKFVARVPLKD